jgi:hypothetical protein
MECPKGWFGFSRRRQALSVKISQKCIRTSLVSGPTIIKKEKK